MCHGHPPVPSECSVDATGREAARDGLGGQWGPSYADGGRGLIQTLPALKEREKHPSRLEAEQIETLIAGKFYEDNKKHHNKWP